MHRVSRAAAWGRGRDGAGPAPQRRERGPPGGRFRAELAQGGAARDARDAPEPAAPDPRRSLRTERRESVYARRAREHVRRDARANPADRTPGVDQAACTGEAGDTRPGVVASASGIHASGLEQDQVRRVWPSGATAIVMLTD